MSEEILNEIKETQTETEIFEIPQRVNDFCVISKFTWENGGRDIQTNSGWSENPYGEDYAIVPDEMVPDIKATQGFCDIVLSEDGTEVVEFTAKEIPEIKTEDVTAEPTVNDIINAMLGLEG